MMGVVGSGGTCTVGDCGQVHYGLGFCKKHYDRHKRSGRTELRSFEERLWEKVDKTETCWLWTASKNPLGYGWFGVGKKVRLAHRVVYEFVVGPIPDGLELDHLCRTPSCVRPDHLEAVSHTINMQRGHKRQRNQKTHCSGGHEFTENNSGVNSKGYRICYICRLTSERKHNAKLKEMRHGHTF